jgi:hypothetical protein
VATACSAGTPATSATVLVVIIRKVRRAPHQVWRQCYVSCG